MSVFAFASGCFALVALVARSWGRARLTGFSEDGGRRDGLYLFAMNYGGAAAMLAGALAVALQAGGAP